MKKHVYIHIPFCLKKCNYCSFYSTNLIKKEDEYINSLTKEIEFYYRNNPIKTLYLGGGTPSILKHENIEKIIKLFNFEEKNEITIEINPFKISLEKLINFKKNKINRISIGVQNFDDDILKIIGRQHNKEDIFKTINNVKKAGFNNFSIDLMYGLPNQTLDNWIETLNIAKKIDIPHISLYGLKIENGTYFSKYPPKNLPNDDTQAMMYEKAIEILKKDYIHYEFSSFAKNENYFSKHNLSYWQRKEYFGFGLSASGFIDNKRYTNTFNYQKYIQNPIEKDFQILSKKENIEEEIFLGLRTHKGIDFGYLDKKYNINIYEKYKKEFDKYLNLGYMQKTKIGVKLTPKGILVSNQILCDFIEI